MSDYFYFLRRYVFNSTYSKAIALACCTIVVTSICAFMTPVISKMVVDSVSSSPDMKLLNTIGAVASIIIMVAALAGGAQNIIANRLTQRIALDMRHTFFKHLQGLSWDFYDRFKPGEMQYRMFNDIAVLAETGSVLPINLAVSLIVLIVANLAMIYLNWKVAAFVNLVLIVNGLAYYLLQARIKKYTEAAQTAADEVYGTTQEQMGRFKLTQLCSAHIWERRKTFGLLRKISDLTIRKNIFIANSGVVINTISSIWSTGILWIGGYFVILKTLTMGDLVAYLSITGLLVPVSSGIVSMIIQYPVIKISLNRMNEIIKQKAGVVDAQESTRYPIAEAKIVFNNVDFSFANTRKPVFTKLNLLIPPNILTVISGPSGIGKSTLLKLMNRLYDPQQGVIEIDGMDIKKMSLTALRKQIGYVGGYSAVFTGTVCENIQYGVKKTSLEDVKAAAKRACIHERIMELPDGYFTNLGSNGVELSDGENQRLAIARCMLMNPKIWLLDEATANLDKDTEERILSNIRQMQDGSTIIMVSHREEVKKIADFNIAL